MLARAHYQIWGWVGICAFLSATFSYGTTNNVTKTAQMFPPFCGMLSFQVASESRCPMCLCDFFSVGASVTLEGKRRGGEEECERRPSAEEK